MSLVVTPERWSRRPPATDPSLCRERRERMRRATCPRRKKLVENSGVDVFESRENPARRVVAVDHMCPNPLAKVSHLYRAHSQIEFQTVFFGERHSPPAQ